MFDYSTTASPEPGQASAPTERLFDYGQTPSQETPQGPGSLLGGNYVPPVEPAKPSDADRPGGSDRPGEPVAPAVIEFAPDNAGDPPTSYDPHLSGFFDAKELDAAVLNKHELKEQLQAARGQVKEALHLYSIGDNAAREMFAAVQQRLDYPRTPEAIGKEREATMTALTKKWGADTPKMIKHAQEVFNDLCRKVPGLADTMIATGAANDPKIIVHLANIGKRTGSKSLIKW